MGLLRFTGLPLQHKVMPVPPSWPGRLGAGAVTVSSRVVVPEIERPMIANMVLVNLQVDSELHSYQGGTCGISTYIGCELTEVLAVVYIGVGNISFAFLVWFTAFHILFGNVLRVGPVIVRNVEQYAYLHAYSGLLLRELPCPSPLDSPLR